ncbi:uncharacterized protein LOC131211573 isoform X2 [Anopheles bellator]|uniref:uncharacterized protein LOC131211573 isoform X2 n=1 Tax=Anopheles bellator TaxID=139047 RepID=UPI00264A46B7|nr:uncharacterized protein LOC131211573 isoform X2 [Anopheles bellator]
MAHVEPQTGGPTEGNELDAGEEGSGSPPPPVSLKRKKVPSIGDAVAVPSEQRSYAAVLKDQEPPAAPSSSALGNLSTANGKRLKLDIKDHGGASIVHPAPLHGEKPPVVRSKPPIPPKPDTSRTPAGKGPRPKKQQVTESQNANTVQKLLVQNEQMRLELSDLRSSLAAERNAVRALRAQNEADLRKTKAECKKLQEALQHQKRNVAAQTLPPAAGGLPAKRTREHELGPAMPEVARGHQPLEVLKLTQELSALRETNRFLEEKYQVSSEAERRKAADIRVQRDLYELRLTQLSKSAKNEIQRLLEELKSKERSIAQLKKELQTTQQTAVAGGCRKERKAAAAKNSAQQSHEMRKLRETESCSGTISKCNSNHSIQSVDADYEQLETRETLELTIVTATTTTSPVPAAEVVSTAAGSDCHPNRRSNGRPEPAADLLGIATTTYGNDEAPQPALPYELPQRTMEAHSDDNDHISSSSSSSCSSASSVETKRLSALAKQSTPPIDCRDPSLGSDTDSALSSMSPQPSSFGPAEPVTDPWQVCGGGGDATEKLTRIKTQLDEMQHRYGSLGQDYAAAKDQIDRLERELLKATKETHELREQNELLEFRIIELEESHDKWSLGSNSSPTVGGSTTKDGWTDTEKEHDELTMLSERSDSGVTSPNSHHHLEDQPSGVPSPCDLSLLDQIPTDDVRKRLVAMTKRPCYDDEDKLALLQILSLLNNLEALSQDHEIAGDDLSLVEMPAPKYNYTLPESSTPPKALQSYRAGAGKIVATVQPFHSTDRSTPAEPAVAAAATAAPGKSLSIASIAETFGGMKKTTRWNTAAALQESGVFVDEPLGAYSAATQTELEDFPCPEKTNAELCAEIEKLNKFRQKIEECKGSAASKVGPQLPAATGDETCDRRRLQFYVERSAALENKLKVYESSGDQQLRLLAERLDRELHLEGWVKQLSERVHHLELDNGRLEEERCELEEVENDTRLRLQRLEEDLEVMGQRNVELELSRGSYQTKYQDAKSTIVGLEELVQKYEEKIFLLEENEHELRDRIEVINMFIPLLLLYNSWQIHEQLKALQQKQREDFVHQQQRHRQPRPRSPPAIQCIPLERIEYYEGTGTDGGHPGDELQQRLSELMKREKELTQNIAELNRAYNETLENADNLWAQMEREYKEKIGRCEQEEATLKAKIAQLEERLGKDAEYASERIAHLEEAENGLKARISRLGKENKELGAKHGGLLEEYGALKDDYTQLQCYLRGPAAEALEREKKRVLALEDELAHTGQMLRDSEDSHRAEVGTLRGRLLAATKELNHIEVTNSELREEVETLEARIRELMTFRGRDEEKIKHLTEELESKQSQIVALQHTRSTGGGGGHSGFRSAAAAAAAGRSLAQELGSYTPRYYEPLGGRRFPDSDGSGSEDHRSSKFSSQRPLAAAAAAFETKEVKSLAETIILNAENRGGVKTPKKSFVEETDN